MLHTQCSYEWSIRLDHNVVLLTEFRDILMRVEWMDFDLIDSGLNAWLGVQKFSYLDTSISLL